MRDLLSRLKFEFSFAMEDMTAVLFKTAGIHGHFLSVDADCTYVGFSAGEVPFWLLSMCTFVKNAIIPKSGVDREDECLSLTCITYCCSRIVFKSGRESSLNTRSKIIISNILMMDA